MTLLRPSEYINRNSFPCPVRTLGIFKLASLHAILKMVRFAFALRKENYQLVHCFFNDSSMIAPIFLKLFSIRVLVSRRDMGFWYTPSNLMVLRLIRPFIDHYVANSCAVKSITRQREWVSDKMISVIYNGYLPSTNIDNQSGISAAIPGVPDDAPVIGILANLRPIKRMDTLVEAFAIVNKLFSDAYLVIVGDNVSEQAEQTFNELEALAYRLGIREKIIFTDLVENPKPFVNRFTVAVLCSESEGFSNSIIEYMLARRPIICTDTGGNPEVVENDRNGLLIPVGDTDALANNLVRLLSDTTLARRLGDAGYETVRSYTHKRMVTEQMDCYDHVLASGRRKWSLYCRRQKRA